MVLTANDLSAWKDFPKGLRVLLLNHDSDSASEIKSKLESMDYIVLTFYNEDDALSAFSSRPESFHIAIVEVNKGNEKGSFKFLETAKDLPVIMTSDIHCLSTMMKCIALGAVEFLQKPLSKEKLRNIWQHVVHKAFNSQGRSPSESLRPVKDSVVDKDLEKAEDASAAHENDSKQSLHSDKYPAPSTPQLNDGDCRDNTNSSTEGESTKSVETTCGNSVAATAIPIDETQTVKKSNVKEEDELGDGSNSDTSIHSNPPSKNNHKDSHTAEKRKAASDPHDGKKAKRKKIKVDWTPELHKKFVQAVEQLGVDQAIPSLILEQMKVEGLTRHNVASHLQKYRMHRRHVLPKEDRKWLQKDHRAPRGCYQHKPIMPFPPLPPGQMYPMWGAPPHPATVPVWGPPSYPSWQPAETWHWKPYPGMHADAWGCPVMPPSQGFYSPFPQNVNHCFDTNILQSCADFQLDEEEIDKVVKEVVSKPWLPLPLGLKPPSTDSVLAELSRQGICTVPPRTEDAY